MIGRTVGSVVIALAVGLVTVVTWTALKNHNQAQVARLAEAESYAARSQLVRHVDQLLAALRNVREYWSEFGHIPRNQWASDAAIELAHFNGVEKVLWDDPTRGVRFAHSNETPSFDYRPSDTEWQSYDALLGRARAATASAMAGPFVMTNGDVYFEIYFVDPHGGDGGRLAALVNAKTGLADLLRDESPGYAVSVYWDETLLYTRGEPALDIPSGWQREGMIRTSLDTLWRVVHVPERGLKASLAPPALGAILLLGLMIAVLLGFLVFENGRARSRAAAAELAEKQLGELNANLEYEVRERTRALADRTADMQTITDSVAHDLRNPMNAVSANAQLLQVQFADQLGSDGSETLRNIGGGIRQMTEILDRLLGLSEVAHATFRREPVDMRALAQTVYETLLNCEPPPVASIEIGALPVESADRKLVETLIMNLIGNALKYTRQQSERRIVVDCQQHDGATVYCIGDNGIGFDARDADRLFVAFQRLDDAQGTEGVGLGLTIAARVVARHGGRIWADSTPGQGAQFFFTLAPSRS